MDYLQKNKIKNFVKDHINILLPLLILTAISRKLIMPFGYLYYFTPIFLILFFGAGYDKLFKNKNSKILIIMLLMFGIWTVATALWSDYPMFSLQRGGYFLLILIGAASGIALWRETINYKVNPFGFLLPANVIVIGISIISLLLGWPEDTWTGGNKHGFMSVFTVQLAFGRALLLLFPVSFYIIIKILTSKKNKRSRNMQEYIINILPHIVIIVLNVILMLLSHSRAALLSLSILILLTFSFIITWKQKLLLYVALALLVLASIQTPFISEKINDYLLKGTSHLTANRDILWGPTWEAAKIGGLFGIGYGTSSASIESNYQIIDESGRLRREKGNSYLALIEEVGIFGLVLFILPVIYVIYIFFHYKQYTKLYAVIGFSLFIGLLVHAQFEDWMVGVSDFTLLIFFMVFFLTNQVLTPKVI